MPIIVIRGRSVEWMARGLPLEAFRINVRGGVAEYRPAPVNAANAHVRHAILLALAAPGGRLAASL
ncbi:hypothetical protein tb265_48790 [Gemmatimonadetes bacterium T265]|nr:hypothetical protein tb265_48790 [Gemmatimonadetes bacterium T265]